MARSFNGAGGRRFPLRREEPSSMRACCPANPARSGQSREVETVMAYSDATAKTPAIPETKAAYEDLKADFAQLKADLAALSRDLKSLGASGASELKSALKTGAAAGAEKAQAVADYASTELQEITSQARSAVRKNPLSAMAAALAIGYFLSSIARR